jgi:hypothetical protein
VWRASFTYDLNGNMAGGAGRAVAYTAFKMTATISPGSSSSSVMLGYDSGHARIQQISAIGTTLYFGGGVGAHSG